MTNLECERQAESNVDEVTGVVIGQRYRILGGAMDGVEGVVQQRTRQAKILLGVNILGQDTLLEISPDRLLRVEAGQENCLATNFETKPEAVNI